MFGITCRTFSAERMHALSGRSLSSPVVGGGASALFPWRIFQWVEKNRKTRSVDRDILARFSSASFVNPLLHVIRQLKGKLGVHQGGLGACQGPNRKDEGVADETTYHWVTDQNGGSRGRKWEIKKDTMTAWQGLISWRPCDDFVTILWWFRDVIVTISWRSCDNFVTIFWRFSNDFTRRVHYAILDVAQLFHHLSFDFFAFSTQLPIFKLFPFPDLS